MRRIILSYIFLIILSINCLSYIASSPTFTNYYTPTPLPTVVIIIFTPTPLPETNLTLKKEILSKTNKIGEQVKYRIIIENRDNGCARNIRVWDTLPDCLKYINCNTDIQPKIIDNFIYWDFSETLLTLCKDNSFIIEFETKLVKIPENKYVINKIMTDYNDGYYNGAQRHPPVFSTATFFLDNIPVIYPNPFKLGETKNNKIKIDNLSPGSLIQIFTISGELVIGVYSSENKFFWDAKNRKGCKISAGIYYWVIKTPANEVYRGSLFVIN